MNNVNVLAVMVADQAVEIDIANQSIEAYKKELAAINDMCGGDGNRAFVKVKALRDECDTLEDNYSELKAYSLDADKYNGDLISSQRDKIHHLNKAVIPTKDAEIDWLNTENKRLMAKRARGKSNLMRIKNALFGDGYNQVGMIPLLHNIKEKMDRHEKTKQKNAELKEENKCRDYMLECLERHCDDAGVGMKDNPLNDRVERLANNLRNHISRSESFEAKASKLNAEKLQLLRLLNENQSDAALDIIADYKNYLKDSAKKDKK